MVDCGTGLYSWVFGYGSKVKIKEPEDVKTILKHGI